MALIALASLALPLIVLLLVAATSVESHLLTPDASTSRTTATGPASVGVLPAEPTGAPAVP